MRNSLQTNKIICIAGLKNSGKDTVAEMLLYLLSAPKFFRTYRWYKRLKKWPFRNKWEITAFAKPLKQTLAIILNKPERWFSKRENKENYYVDLETLKIYPKYRVPENQRLSENKFQKIIKSDQAISHDQLITIRQLMQYYGTECIRRFLGDNTWINATLNAAHNKNIIISDLRFRVELEQIKRLGGITIYISRSSAEPGTHSSERQVIDLYNENAFTYVIQNDGTLKDLFNEIKHIIKNI